MTLTRTIVAENNAAQNGGGIVNNGVATLNEATIEDNHAVNGAGGVRNNSTGQLIITDGAILRNTAELESGGGVYNAGTVTLNHVTVS